MKKALAIIAAIVSAIGLNAQDTNHFRFNIEASSGITRYYNYSPLSLVQDSKDTYTAPTLAFTMSMSRNHNEFGLRYRLAGHRTSALQLGENVQIHDISLLYRHTAAITPNMELFGGVATGFAILHNHLETIGIDGYRHGITAGVEAGLRYRIGKYTWLTLTAGLDATRTFVSHNRIPDGYDPQTGRTLISGHGLGGVSICIPPKVKKINMPAALIVEGDGPILACYQ
ncbi:MAG: hypothetical protein IKR33_06610 [Bacteroidales bacterium]|nr:hypothetical protein [Bacteroidales bacterium]